MEEFSKMIEWSLKTTKEEIINIIASIYIWKNPLLTKLTSQAISLTSEQTETPYQRGKWRGVAKPHSYWQQYQSPAGELTQANQWNLDDGLTYIQSEYRNKSNWQSNPPPPLNGWNIADTA